MPWPLLEPVRHQYVDIASAERFDLVVDFSDYQVGEEVTLVNRLESSASTGRIMRFRVTRRESIAGG